MAKFIAAAVSVCSGHLYRSQRRMCGSIGDLLPPNICNSRWGGNAFSTLMYSNQQHISHATTEPFL